VGQVGSKRILVVDDEAVVSNAICDLLRLDGFEVETAASGQQAIQLCQSCDFDLIFLDFYLPDMQGDALITVLRRTNPRQKIIVVSGHRPLPSVPQAEFLIRKPFTAEVIRKAVARFA
jgi:CheY-like chemotaxis protein